MSVDTAAVTVDRRRDRAWRHDLRGDTVWVVGGFVAAGAVGGLLWWLLWDPATFTVVHGRASMGEEQLSRQFGADAWYALVAVVLAVVTGLVATALRHRRPMAVLVLVLLGAVAAAVVMALLGRWLGPPSPDSVVHHVGSGSHVPEQLGVDTLSAYAAWPLGALLGYLLDYWTGFSERRSQPNRPRTD